MGFLFTILISAAIAAVVQCFPSARKTKLSVPACMVILIATSLVGWGISNYMTHRLYKKTETFITSYLNDMVVSINSNDFSYVEKYLDDSRMAYQEQLGFITEYCKEREIQEKLTSIEITNINLLSDDKIVVDTYEQYNVDSRQGNHNEQHETQYSIKITDDWKIVTINNKS